MYRRRTASSSAAPEAASGGRTSRPSSAISSVSPGRGTRGVLEALLPRKNAFIRPAVANIDQLVVLASCAIPVTEPFLIDRVLAIAQLQNVPALVVVNKDDLAPAQPPCGDLPQSGRPCARHERGNRRGHRGPARSACRKALLPDRKFRRRQIQPSEPRLPAASAARRRGFGKARPRSPYHAPH